MKKVSEKNWDIAELQKIISDRLRMVSEPHEPPGVGGSVSQFTFWQHFLMSKSCFRPYFRRYLVEINYFQPILRIWVEIFDA